jgi:hypothetical protein
VACGDWTIQLSIGDEIYRLCRIWFDKDGTYSITAPYHQANAATAFRSFNLSAAKPRLILETSVRSISLTDDDNRIRLSHHPDGTLEISSPDLQLGDEADTSLTIHGSAMGDELGSMPSFRCTVHDPREFSPGDSMAPETITFDSSLIAPPIEASSFLLDGAWFPADWREFLIRDDDNWIIRIVHGNRGVISLRGLLSSPDCENQGFLGIRVTRVRSQDGSGGGFLLVGIGNKRQEDGVDVTDELCCIYPGPPMSTLPRIGQAEKT